MPTGTQDTTKNRRSRVAVFAATLLVAACAIALGVQFAPAQDPVQQAGDLESSIQGINRQVDSLIGELSGLKSRQADAEAELSAKQAELDRTTAALEAERAHLEVVRARYRRARKVLEDRLVSIYKSGTPDVLTMVLNSASWSDVISQSDYLDRVQQSDRVVVERVKVLRAEVEASVARLAEAQERIAAARDEIQAQRDRLAESRAAVEARRAKLLAARAAQQRALKRLNLKVLGGNEGPVGPPGKARLLPNGQAVPPSNAPAAVKNAIYAANRIEDRPYVWGGGHGSFESSGYDCSGAVSYMLHGGGWLSSPLDSTGLMSWGSAGFGRWVTVFANSGHTYAVVAGLRWDTSGTGGSGPSWSTAMRSSAGYVARHPAGY
jgi:peptidoglycan hydrolase CwlO-like protein